MKDLYLLTLSFFLLHSSNYGENSDYIDFKNPIHGYHNILPKDPFSYFVKKLENGNVKLNFNSEKDYLFSLFKELEISPHSQLLVYSTTSLQLSRISLSNPRAIYFGDDIYVGYVPGGQVEIIGIDPELGAIPYIFNLPQKTDSTHPLIYRSKRCMKCHASEETKGAPGLLLSSVIPGPGGGTLDAFRRGTFGHSIEYEKRFGGWHITGINPFSNSWANYTGLMRNSKIQKVNNPPGKYFSWDKYSVKTSDVIPHLILEHQVGFTNLCISITYNLRKVKKQSSIETKSKKFEEIIEQHTNSLLSYILFQNEALLPESNLNPESPFVKYFQNNGNPNKKGMALRELSLKGRLFKLRCSYMIFSNAFYGLPWEIRNQLLKQLRYILSCEKKKLPRAYAYLAEEERHKINSILHNSLPEYSTKKKASKDAF